jgi:NitT/TauT family transport system substrate-binding protein
MHRDVARERGVTEAGPWDQKLKALRGLTVGATRPGALAWQVAEYVIAQAGLALQKDVQLIAVGIGPSAPAALEQRKVDVMLEGIPVPQTAVERGYGMIFIDYVRGDDPEAREFMLENLLVRPEYLREQPETVRRMVRALLKANRFIADRPAEEVADAVAAFFPGMRREMLVTGLRAVRRTFPANGLLTEAALKGTQDLMEKAGDLKRRHTLQEVFTAEYLPRP